MTSRSRLPSRGSQSSGELSPAIGIGSRVEHVLRPARRLITPHRFREGGEREPQMPTPRAMWLEEPFPNDPDL
jgi:hypothetical protein